MSGERVSSSSSFRCREGDAGAEFYRFEASTFFHFLW